MADNDYNRANVPTLGETIRRAVSVGVFAALIVAGSYVSVPLPVTPVPVALQSLFVFLAALILGPKAGTLAVALFLAMGAIGLPVFAGGRGGPAHFFGPTGGYLLGYLPAAAVCGIISQWGRRFVSTRTRALIDAAAATIGTAVLYASGVTVLARVTGMTAAAAIAAGAAPFLIGDAVKIAVAAAVAPRVRERLIP
ncbi:MAG: biotin transporter BioY, partial [Spirochaetaceae bacterium]